MFIFFELIPWLVKISSLIKKSPGVFFLQKNGLFTCDIVQVKGKPLMFGGCDLAQGRLVRVGHPKKLGDWTGQFEDDHFSSLGPTAKNMGKIVMNHGLYPFFCFFPINISIAEIRRVDTVDTVDSLKLLASFSL